MALTYRAWRKQIERGSTLRHFIGLAQISAIAEALGGEEGEWFDDKLNELADVIESMPRTYATDGTGDAAIAYLHYFTANGDWWITEADSGDDGRSFPDTQHQAYGLAAINGEYPERGYISIDELIRNGAEIDLHWTPKPLAECGD